MGRYTNWYMRIGLIAVLAAIITPIGIFTMGELEPYLSLLPVTEDPQNMQLKSMTLADKELQGESWYSCTWRLEILFTNPLDHAVILPKSALTVRYLNGTLGEGWIGVQTTITANTSTTIYAYMTTKNGNIFETFFRAILNGEPIDMLVDFKAYILIEGMLGEPLMGVIFPTVLHIPMPSEVVEVPPFIYSLERGSVQTGSDVVINVEACDYGTGIANATLYWTKNNITWTPVDMMNPAYWTNIYEGRQVTEEKTFPLITSYWDTPLDFYGTIDCSGEAADTVIYYYVYFEDYAGTIIHDKPGNVATSDTYSFTINTSLQNSKDEEVSPVLFDKLFIIDFIEKVEENGVSLLHYAYINELDIMNLAPKLGSLSEFFYRNDVDADYFSVIFMSDFRKSLELISDSGLSPARLFDALGIDSIDMFNYILQNQYLITQEDYDDLALAIQLGDPSTKSYLEGIFNTLGISRSDIENYIMPDEVQFTLGDPVDRESQFRTTYTMTIDLIKVIDHALGDWLGGIVKAVLGGESYITMAGSQVDDWTLGSGSAYDVWLDLVQTGTPDNYHWAAASLMLSKIGDVDNSYEWMLILLNGNRAPIDDPFPEDDLYPYTHTLSIILVFFPLAVVSYLVIKREIISLRNIKKAQVVKKSFKKKAPTNYK